MAFNLVEEIIIPWENHGPGAWNLVIEYALTQAGIKLFYRNLNYCQGDSVMHIFYMSRSYL